MSNSLYIRKVQNGWVVCPSGPAIGDDTAVAITPEGLGAQVQAWATLPQSLDPVLIPAMPSYPVSTGIGDTSRASSIFSGSSTLDK